MTLCLAVETHNLGASDESAEPFGESLPSNEKSVD
jgi:hypothetical protein